MTPAARLEALEATYLAAREARDTLDIARATGAVADEAALEARSLTLSNAVHEALDAFAVADAPALDGEDRQAYEANAAASTWRTSRGSP